MADYNIALPPVTAPSVVNEMRGIQPPQPFDEGAAFARMQRVAFLSALHANPNAPSIDPALTAEWHAHLSKVAAYSQVKSVAPPTVAMVPRAPRPTVTQPQAAGPTAPKTPALDGVSRRVDMLQKLISPPQHPNLV